eukprot:TRINITY_DN1042_c0_g1_i1.p1 TRINITY_DN1042_c0_g1~~TRINITY_DN1042_c0_g1_i1.p1  ORF type:complete len:1034 (+),score=97.83 TRINITY_DN1042_c0_g1_i1:4392-7493(+)
MTTPAYKIPVHLLFHIIQGYCLSQLCKRRHLLLPIRKSPAAYTQCPNLIQQNAELAAGPKLKASDSFKNGTNVSVMCRVRPFNAKENELIEAAKLHPDPKHKDMCVEFHPEDKRVITVFTPNDKPDKEAYEKHDFRLDYVFECGTDQAMVYETAAKPIVNGVLEGFNGTVLAYGQTSSGKTYTMQGDIDSDIFRGIIPRMVETIFEAITRASETMEFTVKASMIEIYNEKVRDLLDSSKDNLGVHEDKQRGVYVEGLTEVSIGNEYDVYELMKEGNSNRAIAETKMNAQSSRSHSIFILTMIMNDLENLSCKTGKLYLVDLAGSEMISKTGASGQTLEEAKNINKSLTMLGRVITALTDGKSTHVPYRDSKLTRILQDSLGGNSKTCLIVTASPSMYNAAETLSTCRFGMRAKSIKNNAKVNKQVTVAELKLAIANLEKELGLRNKRIGQLEGFLISKGLTLGPADEDKLYAEEPEKLAAEDTSMDSRTTVGTEAGSEQPTKEDAGIGSEPIEETKDGKMEHAAVIKLYNQLEQQRDLISKPMLDKQKEEQQSDLDTLINQLRQERKKTRAKDEKLQQLRKELNAKVGEMETTKAEASELSKQLQEKAILLATLKKELEEKLAKQEAAPSNESQKDILKALLADPELDAKTKEKIAKRASLSISTENLTVTPEGKVEDEKERTEMIAKNKKLKQEVLELQMRLAKEKEFYKKQLETNSIELLKRKITILEKSMEQLSKYYYDHINKIAYLNLDIQMKQKQLERKTHKLEEYEKQVGKLKEELKQSKLLSEELKKVIWENVPTAAEILSQPLFSNAKPFYVYQANLVRSIRGGGGKKGHAQKKIQAGETHQQYRRPLLQRDMEKAGKGCPWSFLRQWYQQPLISWKPINMYTKPINSEPCYALINSCISFIILKQIASVEIYQYNNDKLSIYHEKEQLSFHFKASQPVSKPQFVVAHASVAAQKIKLNVHCFESDCNCPTQQKAFELQQSKQHRVPQGSFIILRGDSQRKTYQAPIRFQHSSNQRSGWSAWRYL